MRMVDGSARKTTHGTRNIVSFLSLHDTLYDSDTFMWMCFLSFELLFCIPRSPTNGQNPIERYLIENNKECTDELTRKASDWALVTLLASQRIGSILPLSFIIRGGLTGPIPGPFATMPAPSHPFVKKTSIISTSSLV